VTDAQKIQRAASRTANKLARYAHEARQTGDAVHSDRLAVHALAWSFFAEALKDLDATPRD